MSDLNDFHFGIMLGRTDADRMLTAGVVVISDEDAISDLDRFGINLDHGRSTLRQ